MKRFLLALIVTLSAASMVVTEAEARRLGGGGSFGRQSQSFSRQAPAQAPAQKQVAPTQGQSAAAPAAAPKPASPWRNILGGALLGLGLGALLSHLGLSGPLVSMIGTMLMIALLVFAAMFIVRFFRARNGGGARPAMVGAQPSLRTPDIGSRLDESRPQPAAFQAPALSGGGDVAVPAGFEVEPFLRNAKTYFIRLQAAWDKADINDIREFTSTEMFGELRLQIQERGAASNFTDAVSLDAELLGVERIGDDYLASVKFSGVLREAENASAEPFAEIWNLSKPVSGQGGWVLAGIQQLS